ncbi:MAG TPA: hypothetical protein VHF70_08680 [Rubrobacteraceae bacterium]|nr:hypothetical protein [Rubrobacteraceae bacterium]
MGFLLTLLLVVIGLLLLLLSLGVVAFGVYMALDERHRERGIFLAVWWVPAVAASIGILMRDSVTFTVGGLCFVVAGTALVLDLRGTRKPARQRPVRQKPAGQEPAGQEPAEQRPVRSRRTGGARKPTLYEGAKRRISDKIKEYRKTVS